MIMQRFLPALLLSSVIASSGSRAQSPVSVANHPGVENALTLAQVWLEAERAYDEIPGISAAIVHDQQVLWSGGYGLADVASRRPTTSRTIYSICSISKLFTSIGVMQLRDAGKLRLDDPVSTHLPWFTLKKTAPPPDGPEITIEGILTHASGLPRESDHPYWSGDFRFPAREEVIGRLGKQETLYPAETYFQYSNLGLTLAGEVVAATSGQAYAEYIHANILKPLGLESTTSEMPEAERGKRLATGYSAIMRDGTRKPLPFFLVRGIAPAAGYASTAEDLARFASWQFRLLDKGGREVLKANTLREMQRVHWVDPNFETTWGLGFSVWRSDGKTFTGHGGSCPGYRTHLLLKPDEKIATIFMANALGVNSQLWAQRTYDIIAPALKSALKQPARATASASGNGSDSSNAARPDPQLAKYLGTYESSFGGEIAVVRWDDGLAMLFLPTKEPVKNLIKLRKAGEHTFRRIRKDDEKLAESIVFEMGADGRPVRILWNSNHYPRRL